MFSKLLGVIAVIWLVMLVVGRIVGLPLWVWAVMIAVGLIAIIIDRVTTKRNTLR